MTKPLQIDNSLENTSQSWVFTSLWRVPVVSGEQLWLPKQIRIEVRANAYEDQSRATLSEWSDGWKFFTGIPTDEWYAEAPSYTTRDKAKLQVKHLNMFTYLEQRLIQTFMRATYGPTRDYDLEYLPDA
jgi:hypothetical protein